MDESDYIKLPWPLTGYDEAGLICIIYAYQKEGNPDDKIYRTSDGEPATKISENKYRLASGRIICISHDLI